MVVYHEGDPRIPGNAELEAHELAAFQSENVKVVTEAGENYGATCTDYAATHDWDASGIVVGMRGLMQQPALTLESFRMRIHFMEGVQSGVHSRIVEIVHSRIVEIKTGGRELEAAQALDTLANFGKRPEVQAVLARQSKEAFDNLSSALQGMTTPSE